MGEFTAAPLKHPHSQPCLREEDLAELRRRRVTVQPLTHRLPLPPVVLVLQSYVTIAIQRGS